MKCSICVLVFVSLAFGSSFGSQPQSADIIYGYECKSNKCVKVLIDENNFKTAVSQSVCNLFCEEEPNAIGTLWPKPTGKTTIGNTMVHIDPKKIEIHGYRHEYYNIAKERFMRQIAAKFTDDADIINKDGKSFSVNVVTEEGDDVQKLTLETDESYKLTINDNEAYIKANSFYGARHGLETLAQLIVYDDIRRELQVVGKAEINDAPVYKHRGIMLDTSRNYYSVEAIKKIIDTMGSVKLNTFHWHITDTHSFPFEMKSQPELYKKGAYTSKKIYTHKAIGELVKYGRAVGVRLLPEFDQPAHIGEGWKEELLTCFKYQPWSHFCVEPPCGQVDPSQDEVYDTLEKIYSELYEAFDAPDWFHVGGDEVSVECWNTSSTLQAYMKNRGWGLTEQDFMKLWGDFQVKALERLDRITKTPEKVPVVFWTSRLTEVPYVDDYLDPKRYTIQIWTTGFDKKIEDLLERGYKLIMSNYDALYLDCGFGGWVTDGLNWCAPYIGWHKVYENNPKKIAGKYHEQVIGSEAAVWSEQIDDFTIDSRFWPRASALAERLWSDPQTSWRDAEHRMLVHRERLVENGVRAESIQPEWCRQNEGECPI
ncbi:Hexo1 family protein [Megaselia abdita]